MDKQNVVVHTMDYYSGLKRCEHENITLGRKSQTPKDRTLGFHSYEISSIGKSTEMEKRFVAAPVQKRAGRKEGGAE